MAFQQASQHKRELTNPLNTANQLPPVVPTAQIQQRLRRQGVDALQLYQSTTNKPAKPYLIPGIRSAWFNLMVEAVILHWAEYHEYPKLSQLKAYCPDIPYMAVSQCFKHENFLRCLVDRGLPPIDTVVVDSETGQSQSYLLSEALSARQMLAISVMTDVSSRANIKTKLSRIGVTQDEWANWLRNRNFREKFDRLAKEVFIKAQSSIDMQVASGALDGKLDFIKYYNELSGRHDPKKQSRLEVQQVLQAVVDIIMRNVTDPVVLNQINAELQLQLQALDI